MLPLKMLTYFLIIVSAHSILGSEIMRPRGVAISKSSLYNPGIDFTCFDGTVTIPYKYVNDDYCDCPDGTDEPGTAACPNGIFHCTNAGHQSLNIPSSRVNDGICDCCDATDEYLTGNCSDFCNKLGEEARREAQKRAELIKMGSELRQELIQQGKLHKQKKQERIITLQRDQNEAESVKAEKELLKSEAESAENVALQSYREIEEAEKARKTEEEKKAHEEEAMASFKLIDSNQDGKIVPGELQSRNIFDTNKDGAVSEDEVKFFFGTAEELNWDQFFADAYPRMKPFIMMEKGLFTPPTKDQEGQQNEQGDQEAEEATEDLPEEDWEEEEKPEEEEEEPESTKDEKENIPEDEAKPKYDPETQNIIDVADKARNEFEQADRALRDIERELKHIEESLAKDFGPEDEFAALDGECFEYNEREYTYKLCPFDQVSQKQRSGGAETRLGVWNDWVGGEDKYSAMMYDKGQSCWNGPQRSTRVEISCGLENAVTSATEPNRCEYVFHFVTPSACRPEETSDVNPHDEL
uniref:Glucosidase 2 subunit beta n=1 Tax=Clastoptera arizonana TaxID=38151 RepID=A0A1B6D3J4_9HEMI